MMSAGFGVYVRTGPLFPRVVWWAAQRARVNRRAAQQPATIPEPRSAAGKERSGRLAPRRPRAAAGPSGGSGASTPPASTKPQSSGSPRSDGDHVLGSACSSDGGGASAARSRRRLRRSVGHGQTVRRTWPPRSSGRATSASSAAGPSGYGARRPSRRSRAAVGRRRPRVVLVHLEQQPARAPARGPRPRTARPAGASSPAPRCGRRDVDGGQPGDAVAREEARRGADRRGRRRRRAPGCCRRRSVPRTARACHASSSSACARRRASRRKPSGVSASASSRSACSSAPVLGVTRRTVDASSARTRDPALVPHRLGRLVDAAVGAEDQEAVEAAGEPPVVRHRERPCRRRPRAPPPAPRRCRGRGCRSARRAAASCSPPARAAAPAGAPAGRPTACRRPGRPGRAARSGAARRSACAAVEPAAAVVAAVQHARPASCRSSSGCSWVCANQPGTTRAPSRATPVCATVLAGEQPQEVRLAAAVGAEHARAARRRRPRGRTAASARSARAARRSSARTPVRPPLQPHRHLLVDDLLRRRPGRLELRQPGLHRRELAAGHVAG